MKKIDVEQLDSKIYNEEIWQKYYSYDRSKFVYPESLIYHYLQECNKDNMDGFCINYFGKRMTYRELFDKINECLYSLYKCGVKENDFVSICMPTTPEAIIAYYAINKIGAVSNFIDVRKNKEEIKYRLNNVNSKILLTLDSTLESIKSIVDQTGLDKVIYISALESAPRLIKYPIKGLQKIKGKFKDFSIDSGYINWNEFMMNNQNFALESEPHYYKNRLAIIEYTSGSTGVPKAVALSNDTINNRVYQYKNNGMVYSTGDVYMDIIPMFIAFGAVVGVHLPLCMGMEDALIPAYSDENVVKLLKQYSPKHFTLTPASYNYLTSHPKFKTLYFGDKLTLACGGDGMNATENARYNLKLAHNGSLVKINNGYGGSETGAPFCTEKNGACKDGSVGIPLPGNKVIIFKHGTYEPIEYNEVGDICMVVDGAMIEYLNNEELTNKVKINMSDGKTGIMLGDCGYVDEDGFVFIKGRYENALSDTNGELIWPVDIENIIYSIPYVYSCAISKSNTNIQDNILYVVLSKNTSYNTMEIEKIIYEQVKLNLHNDIEFKIEFVEKLPLTSSGKIDRKKLKSL